MKVPALFFFSFFVCMYACVKWGRGIGVCEHRSARDKKGIPWPVVRQALVPKARPPDVSKLLGFIPGTL